MDSADDPPPSLSRPLLTFIPEDMGMTCPMRMRKKNKIEAGGADSVVFATTAAEIMRWISKLFTGEDLTGFRKFIGLFVLWHFDFRYRKMIFVDLSTGLGSWDCVSHGWWDVP